MKKYLVSINKYYHYNMLKVYIEKSPCEWYYDIIIPMQQAGRILLL